MNISEAIRKRRSVRSFSKTPLSRKDAERIMKFAETADNPFGLEISWYLLDGEKDGVSSVVISNCDCYIAGKMKKVPHAEEAFGYSFERIVLYAHSIGVGTTWIAGTMDRKAFERAIDLQEDEVMPCVSPLGYPADKMSFRELMMRKGVKADLRQDFEKLFFLGDFSHPLKQEDAGELKEALQLVRLGPSAVNKQPWRIVVTDRTAHFYKAGKASDSWDIQKIDIGIAICHFMEALKEKGHQPVLTVSDPGLTAPEAVYVASCKW